MIRKVCFFGPKKKSVLCKLNRFYKLKIGLDQQKSVFCNPVLPYPSPSYQIPSLPHPTRILNTTLHLYKILLTYTTLSHHIEIEPNRPTVKKSRIGTPPKFTQAEKSRPKRPKLCCLHSQNAEIIWTGLQSHSSAQKNVFLARIYGKIGSSPHSIKMYTKQIRFETGHNWVSGKCFAYMIRTFPKIIEFFTFKLEWNTQIRILSGALSDRQICQYTRPPKG